MTTTHRMSGTPTHTTWRKMRERCSNPNARQWPWYGARGIRVCDRWESFENFLADMGTRPPGATIDRIDGDLGYTPSNCRWATAKEQHRNQRNSVRHGSVSLRDACETSGISFDAAYQRIKRGVPAASLLPLDAFSFLSDAFSIRRIFSKYVFAS